MIDTGSNSSMNFGQPFCFKTFWKIVWSTLARDAVLAKKKTPWKSIMTEEWASNWGYVILIATCTVQPSYDWWLADLEGKHPIAH